LPAKIAVGLVVLAVPLALLPAASSQAAPTLTVAQAQAQLAALETQEDAAVEHYDAGVIAVTAAKQQVAVVQKQLSSENAKLTSMQAQVAAFASAAYTSGGMGGVIGLLTSANPQAALNRTAGLDEIARLRSAQITGLDAERTLVKNLQTTAKQRAAAAARTEHQLSAAKASVITLIAKQEAVISHLQAKQRAELLAQQAAQEAAARAAAARASRAAARAVLVATPAPVVSTPASGPTDSSPPPPSSSGVAAIVLAAAYSQLGKPYVYGGSGPNVYDCSGLVMWAFAHAGIYLPHSAEAQSRMGTQIPLSEIQPGDVLYFSDGGGYIGHVGIYVGGGDMIDANHTGGWVGIRPIYGDVAGATRF
jgi:cell wall-associated NlpC family hydrolase